MSKNSVARNNPQCQYDSCNLTPGELWPGENEALDADLLALVKQLRSLAFVLKRGTKGRAEEKAAALCYVARAIQYRGAKVERSYGEAFDELADYGGLIEAGDSILGDEA